MKKMRKIPLIIAISLSLCLLIWPLLVARLGPLWLALELSVTLTLMLTLMVWFNDVVRERAEHRDERRKQEAQPLEEPLTADQLAANPYEEVSGLVYLQKQPKDSSGPAAKNRLDYLFEGFYLLCFVGITVWRFMRVIAEIGTPSITWQQTYGLDGVVVGLMGVGILIYLKLRQRVGHYAGDRVAQQLLSAWAYTLVAIGVLIGVEVILGLSLADVHRWLILGLSLYLPLAMSGNLIFSWVKIDLNPELSYVLFPPVTLLKQTFASQDMGDTLGRLQFSPKSLYTLRYGLQLLPVLVLGLGAVLLLSTSFVVVQPYQQGAVYRLGRLTPDRIVGGGLHVGWPFPIDRVVVMDMSRIHSREIGFSSPDSLDNIWTQVHPGGEHLLLLGGGTELVAVNMVLTYTLTDLYAYLSHHSEPTELLLAHAYERLLARTHHSTLEGILSTDRRTLAQELLAALNGFAQAEGLGVTVSHVLIEGIHPPVEVAPVYQRVVSATLERNAIVTRAYAQAQEHLIQATQMGQTAVLDAQARQTTRVATAAQELERFTAEALADAQHGPSFRLNRFLATFEQVVGTHPVHVFSDTLEGQLSQFVLRLGDLRYPDSDIRSEQDETID